MILKMKVDCLCRFCCMVLEGLSEGSRLEVELDTDWQGRLDNDIEINVQQKSFFFSEFLYDQ